MKVDALRAKNLKLALSMHGSELSSPHKGWLFCRVVAERSKASVLHTEYNRGFESLTLYQ